MRSVYSDDATRSSLVASWRRCVIVHGLDPVREIHHRFVATRELQLTLHRMENILTSAGPHLDRLYNLLGPKSCILISDVDGIAVKRIGRDAEAEEQRAAGLWTGVDWSEQAKGTNGIGTCLVEKAPLIIHREQHFHISAIGLTCAGSPLYNEEGKMVGAMNVTLHGQPVPAALPKLILNALTDVARQIEFDRFHNAHRSRRVVSLPSSQKAGAALVAIDEDDVVVAASRTAQSIFGLTRMKLDGGICLTDLLNQSDGGFASAEHGVLRRSLIRANGNVSEAARLLDISRATIKRKIKTHNLQSRWKSLLG